MQCLVVPIRRKHRLQVLQLFGFTVRGLCGFANAVLPPILGRRIWTGATSWSPSPRAWWPGRPAGPFTMDHSLMKHRGWKSGRITSSEGLIRYVMYPPIKHVHKKLQTTSVRHVLQYNSRNVVWMCISAVVNKWCMVLVQCNNKETNETLSFCVQRSALWKVTN